MLYSIISGKYANQVPHKKDFDKWMKNLSAADYQAIVDTLNEKIDESDINTAGWLPIKCQVIMYKNYYLIMYNYSECVI